MSVTIGEGLIGDKRDPEGSGREMFYTGLPVLRFHVILQIEGKTEGANSTGIQQRVKQWFSTGTDFVMSGVVKTRECCWHVVGRSQEYC